MEPCEGSDCIYISVRGVDADNDAFDVHVHRRDPESLTYAIKHACDLAVQRARPTKPTMTFGDSNA